MPLASCPAGQGPALTVVAETVSLVEHTGLLEMGASGTNTVLQLLDLPDCHMELVRRRTEMVDRVYHWWAEKLVLAVRFHGMRVDSSFYERQVRRLVETHPSSSGPSGHRAAPYRPEPDMDMVAVASCNRGVQLLFSFEALTAFVGCQGGD